jgi:hypothetical protein
VHVVSPRDCALVAALPMTRAQFLADLRDPRMHYARHVVHLNAGVDDEGAWRFLEPQLAYVDTVLDAVESEGVRVFRRATLASVEQAFAESRVVTLLTHLHVPDYVTEDILDPDAVLKAVRVGSTVPMRALQASLMDDSPETTQAKVLRALRTVATDSWRPYGRDHPQSVPVDPESFEASRAVRFELDDALSSWVRPARAIELVSGLCTVDEFAAAIPLGFDGLVDMDLCHGMVIARAIKRRRPTCLVMGGEAVRDPASACFLYRLVIGELSREPRDYLAATVTVRRAVANQRRN